MRRRLRRQNLHVSPSAREIGEQQIFQECLEIADNTQEFGEIVTEKVDGSTEVKRADMIEHRKLRIETRLKLLAKWNPKKYGDKLGLEHSGELNIGLADRISKARARKPDEAK